MNYSNHLIAEAALARVIKQAGKYVIKKADGTIDPKTFNKSKDAIKYRNEVYYNKGQVEKGARRAQDLGRSGSEYEVKDTTFLPRRGPDGKLRDFKDGRSRTYSSYADWVKRGKFKWYKSAEGKALQTFRKAAEWGPILSLSSWASVAQVVYNWYDDIDAIHQAYAAKEIEADDAELAIDQVTQEALSKGVLALTTGKLLSVIGKPIGWVAAKVLTGKSNTALQQWLMLAAGPVQQQITTALIVNEVFLREVMLTLLNIPYVRGVFQLGSAAIRGMSSADDITAELDRIRTGSTRTSQATQTKGPKAASNNEPPVVAANTPAAQSTSIDWVNDDPETIKKKIGSM